jgi:hypothetical protein
MTRARLFQLALLWLVVSAMVWLTTIWRWQGQGADVGTSDILLQLFALPLMLAGVLAAAIWLVGRTRREAAAPVVPQVARTAVAPASAGAPLQADTLDASLPWASAVVLAEPLNLSVGPDAAQALEAMRGGQLRPGLDAELQDVDGMPVFAARHTDLDTEAWLEAADAASPQAEPWAPEAARALALLEPVLHQAMAALMAQAGPDAPGWLAWQRASQQSRLAPTPSAVAEPDQPTYLSGVAKPESPAVQLARKAQAPLLHVRLVLPPSWPAAQREQAVAWVKTQCGALLDWSEAMGARGVNWLVEPLLQNEDLWTEVDQMLVRWHRDARPELCLLLATDTAISEQVVERMQARGELFTGQHQVGRMPGEAAAGLLLGTAHWVGQAVGDPRSAVLPQSKTSDEGAASGDASRSPAAEAIRLWRPLRARRDKSADALGRLGVTALAGLLQQVSAQHQPQPDALQLLSDADHRASRTGELYEAVTEVTPGVDPMLAITRVGQACGDLGVAGALVPCALASAWLRSGATESSPADAGAAGLPMALAALLQSPHERVVVPLAPWARVVKAAEPAAQAAA